MTIDPGPAPLAPEDIRRGQEQRLLDAWSTPKGWRYWSAVNNMHVGLWYTCAAFVFFLFETAVAARAVAMVQDGGVIAVDGSRVAIRADTICLHGDSPGADVMAMRIRDAFAAAGISVVAPAF